MIMVSPSLLSLELSLSIIKYHKTSNDRYKQDNKNDNKLDNKNGYIPVRSRCTDGTNDSNDTSNVLLYRCMMMV